jgi:hypothetical protein
MTNDPSAEGLAPILLTTPEAARLLMFKPKTLEELRRRGGGPPFVRLSRRAVRYRLSDLNAWLATRTFESTAEGR